ncbi:MAG TPA: class I SAM-dependent methyltransferase [Thermoanaerobaculia bacterium]|nr:class I SAM-dependent methyltransferase [Thermoanaerobaculia bacterium]
MAAAPILLAPREAYRRWAPRYAEGNALTDIDAWAVERLGAPEPRASLDVGCGPGPGASGARGFGVDLVFEMLAAGRPERADARVAAADVLALPFADASFDLVLCRLTIGYVADLARAYSELARVASRGGSVVVTDFHPHAARSGLVRSFKDGAGTLFAIAATPHDPEAQARAASDAGLDEAARLEVVVGPELRPIFERRRTLPRYEEQLGNAVLLAFRFGKRAS